MNYRNSPPTKIELSQQKIDENLKKGSLVGILNTTDIDKIERHSYALVEFTNYPDNFYFEIVGNQLRTKI